MKKFINWFDISLLFAINFALTAVIEVLKGSHLVAVICTVMVVVNLLTSRRVVAWAHAHEGIGVASPADGIGGA